MDYFIADAISKKIRRRFANKVKQEVSLGDCILFDREDIVGDGIEWIQNSKVSHVAIYVGEGMIVEALETGRVELNPLDNYFNEKYRWMIRRINDITEKQKRILIDAVSEYIGDRYDWFQLITLGIFLLIRKLTGFRWYWVIGQSRENMMICSELFCVGAVKAGINLFPNIKLKAITPELLYKTETMKTIRELSYEDTSLKETINGK